MATLELQQPIRIHKERSRWREMMRVVRGRASGMAGLLLVLFFVLLAVAAPWLSPHDPITQPAERLSPPDATYWLGVD